MSKIEHHGVVSAGPSRCIGVCRVVLVLLAAMVCCMVVFVTPATAGQARLLSGIFGAETSTPANPYPLSSAMRVAVDTESHDVYVVDGKSRRVEKFDSTGHFILMFGKEVDRTTGGNVCTAASGDVCQAGVSGSSPGAFVEPEWVAVDNSGVFGQQGGVYVSDGPAGTVSKFNPEGQPISSWGNNGEGLAKNGPPNGQLNGANATGPVAGPFGQIPVSGLRFGGITGIAVDRSGNLWVKAKLRMAMFEFRPSGTFATDWEALDAEGGGVAVDAEDNVYTGTYASKFKSTGEANRFPIGRILEDQFASPTARDVAVDQGSNELYVVASGGPTKNTVNRYELSSCHPTEAEGDTIGKHCTPAESFGSHYIHLGSGLASDPSTPADTIYVAEDSEGPHFARVLAFPLQTVPDVLTGKATGFTATSATLNGSVNPAGIELQPGLEGCRFEWGEHGAGEAEPYGHSVPCDKTAVQIGSGTSPVEVHATIAGLQQGKAYHFRLVAANHNQITALVDEPSLGSDLAFGPPSIESASPIAVGASDATLRAQVNPNNVATRVRLEYGTEAGVYGHSTTELDLGSNGTGQLTSFQLSGLSPGTTYHYRFVAENALGEGPEAILSGDRVFETQLIVSGPGLLDGRGWEMVSPADKHGAELSLAGIWESTGPRASDAGGAIGYLANAATESEPAGSPTSIQVLSRRTAGGWVSRDIALPNEGPAGVEVGIGKEYRFFSSDLSSAVVEPRGGFVASLSPEASEQTPYIRTNFVNGNVESPCLSECFRPLVTGAPGYENVPSETVFAPGCEHGKLQLCGPVFLGASNDLSHVVLTSSVPLIEGAPAGPTKQVGSDGGSLYEWGNGRLTLISVLPNTQPAPTGGLALGYRNALARNAISSDGSRVVWSDAYENLYVRDVARKETVQVGSGKVEFQVANRDVSKIVFVENGDLRECAIVENGEGKIHCETSDLSPVGAGESSGVLGTVPGASEDGSYVYFVANGVLENGGVPVPGARPGGCKDAETVAGVTCNLYISHNGVVRLVAEISGEDSPNWGDQKGSLLSLTTRVSPDGNWFAFMSDRSLTGYDNRDSVSGQPDEEVYLYDAVANSGEGVLVCASCNPTGARPHGVEFGKGNLGEPIHIGHPPSILGFGDDRWLAGIIPGWTPYRLETALFQSRYLSDSGRLFFNSTDALVPQDSNGTGDVYEFELAGVGDCTSASAMFSAVSGGCVGLISSGTAGDQSEFMDASENGDDVFFLTVAQLSPADKDKALDVYDARVGGGFPEPSPTPACEGDACQSPVSAPEDPTPGSLTFQGPGNQAFSSTATIGAKQKAKPLTRAQKLTKALNACKRNRSRRARAVCARNAHKRYGPIKGGRANLRRGGR